MTEKLGRRTFIAGCTVGAASLAVGTGTASAAAEQVEVTVTGRGGQVTKIEDFSSPDPYDSSAVTVNSSTLQVETNDANLDLPTDGTGSATQPAGSGTSADPYQVTTVNELAYMSTDNTSYYELQNDLVFPDPADTGLYDSSGWSPVNTFGGTLDGQGYSMTNFFIDRSGDEQGLFTGFTGTAKNFQISGDVSAVGQAGMVVGYLDSGGTVENVSVHGSVSGKGRRVGSVVGENRATVSNVYSDADVALTDLDQGGLVGYNDGTVEKAVYTGSMGSQSTGDQSADVGSNAGTITDVYYNSDNVGLSGKGTGLTTSEMTGSDASTNMNLDFTNTWETVEGTQSDAESDSYPILQSVDRPNQLVALGVYTLPVGYWIDKYTVDLSGEYRVAVPESISSELRISDTVPDGSETTVSPGEEVTFNSTELYVRWDLASGESIDEYSVEIDSRIDLGDVTVAGTTQTVGRLGSAGTTFTTSVALDTGYDISTTESPDAFDVEIQGTKIREAGGAIVLENGNPQPRGSLYYAPDGESILEIPAVDAGNWKFELVAGSGNVTVDDLDLSEYVKRSELDSNGSDIELISEDEGGIPPSDGGGPLDQVGEFFRGIGRSISETVNSIRRRVTGS